MHFNRFSINNYQASFAGSKSCKRKDCAVFLTTVHKEKSSKNQQIALYLDLRQICFAFN